MNRHVRRILILACIVLAVLNSRASKAISEKEADLEADYTRIGEICHSSLWWRLDPTEYEQPETFSFWRGDDCPIYSDTYGSERIDLQNGRLYEDYNSIQLIRIMLERDLPVIANKEVVGTEAAIQLFWAMQNLIFSYAKTNGENEEEYRLDYIALLEYTDVLEAVWDELYPETKTYAKTSEEAEAKASLSDTSTLERLLAPFIAFSERVENDATFYALVEKYS